MKKGIKPVAVSAKNRKCKFLRSKDSKQWESGVAYYDGDRLLAIEVKGQTVLCPPHKVK